MKRESAGISLHREYLRGRVVALAERLQEADGDEAFSIIDQLIETAHEFVDSQPGGHDD